MSFPDERSITVDAAKQVTVSISINRRVQWIDTDAGGIWHYSTIIRWAEEAEVELHRQLGIVEETFAATPRVRAEFDFRTRLLFDDEVQVTLSVTDLGATSITYQIEIRKDGDLAASGRIVAVLIDRTTSKKTPWPDPLRRALTGP